MKKIILSIALIAFSSMGFAQGNSNGGSTSTSTSGSGAVSGAANGTNYQGVTTINQSSRGVKQDKWVPDAIAPGLTTTLTETCMGSTTGAFTVSGLGLSGGTTWTDEACVRRLDARELGSQGAKGASLERMCENAENRAAILRSHKQYPNSFVCYADTPEGKAEGDTAEVQAQIMTEAETEARNDNAFADLDDF